MNNVRFAWAMLATSASINPENKALSLVGLVEEVELNIPQPKPDQPLTVPFNPLLVVTWLREKIDEESNLDVKIEFTSPSNQVLNVVTEKIIIPLGSSRHRHLVRFGKVKIDNSGAYKYVIKKIDKSDEVVVGAVELKIKVIYKQ